MLPGYFDYTFVHLRQKVHLGPELRPKFLSTLGSNPARTRPEKPGPTYNSGPITPGLSFAKLRLLGSNFVNLIFVGHT